MSVYMKELYPKTAVAYMFSVILITILNTHPLMIFISLTCAVTMNLLCIGVRATGRTLRFTLPLMMLMAVITPLTEHSGMTIVTYLPWGNPLTVEAAVYGVAAGFNMGSVILWCSLYNRIVTTDKLISLTGRALPALSLMLCMVTSAVPKFIETMKITASHQKLIYGEKTGKKEKLKGLISTISTVITWSLENGIQTAQSMRARGYGTAVRTAYLRHKESSDHKRFKYIWLLSAAVVIIGMVFRLYKWSYFIPSRDNALTALKLPFFVGALLLYALPILFEGKERAAWKKSNSKM